MKEREIENRCLNLEIDYAEIKECYNEPHRFYHNWKHILSMLEYAEKTYFIVNDELFLSIIFHDVYYNPESDSNEEISVKKFERVFNEEKFSYISKKAITEAIIATKTPWVIPINALSRKLIECDLHQLLNFEKSVINESLIYKEYSFLEFDLYMEKHVLIISKIFDEWKIYKQYNPRFVNYLKNKIK